MNKIIAGLAICSILVFVWVTEFSEDKLWQKWDTTLFETSKKHGKLIMLKVVKDNCHYCSDMEKSVFSESSIRDLLKDNFVPVSVNLSLETVPLGLKPSMTPSFYFIDSERKVVKQIVGSWGRDDFSSFVHNILKAQ